MTSLLNKERLEIIESLLRERKLIECLEGDNLKENNEKRIKEINNILDTLRKLNPNLKKERQSIVSFVNHPPRKKINQRKDEDLFVQMCFKIKNEKKQNPHLFHFISNRRPGSLEFIISDTREYKNGLNRGIDQYRLRNDPHRNINSWWSTVSVRTKSNPNNKKRWLLIPPVNLDATDISDYCKKYEEKDFRNLFQEIKSLNEKLEKDNKIQYTICTEGLEQNILHIRFEPPKRK